MSVSQGSAATYFRVWWVTLHTTLLQI